MFTWIIIKVLIMRSGNKHSVVNSPGKYNIKYRINNQERFLYLSGSIVQAEHILQTHGFSFLTVSSPGSMIITVRACLKQTTHHLQKPVACFFSLR